MASRTPNQHQAAPFWRDERVLHTALQVIVVGAVVAFLGLVFSNLYRSLDKQGLLPSFRFLQQTAQFDIGESSIAYTRNDSYIRAFLVGFLNTLRVSVVGIVLATILGIVVGVARLSANWLVRKIASVYVELLRNVPLLVILYFLSTAFFFKLPRVQEAVRLPGGIFLSNRGVFAPWPEVGPGWGLYRWLLLVALAVAMVTAAVLLRRGRSTGRMPLVGLWAPAAFLLVAAVGWLFMPAAPLHLDAPILGRRNFEGGVAFTPEFMALLLGLVIYTAAFIAEIVRAGLLAVSKGQLEAATALGLSPFQTLRLVTFPQAMRVIIPPLTSQYLNLTKNSSLAVAVGYPDLFGVGNTILNQSGRAVETILIAMLVYLSFSLLTSALMNWYNRRTRLVER